MGRIKFQFLLWLGIISLVINMVIGLILFTPVTESLYRPLIKSELPRRGSVIVVLSCGGYESGVPGFETLIRLRKGQELYRAGFADKIICAGGSRFETIQKTIAQLMKETLILNGVRPDDILIQDDTLGTFNDIKSLIGKFGPLFDFNRSLFVTSSYHTFRVQKILRKMKVSAAVISAVPYQLTPKSVFERFPLFREIVREYMAIFYYWAKGYI